MSDPSFGTWLRRERERRGTTLRAISEQTKVSLPLLEGLEADDLSRWPAGIFRRAFVRSYASAIGLDPDDAMKRFELEHCPAEPPPVVPGQTAQPPVSSSGSSPAGGGVPMPAAPRAAIASKRTRLLGTAADLTVALVLGLGSAAAGSRLLWPVLLIAFYYALGILLTGTSPMVALLNDQHAPAPEGQPASPAAPRPATERRHPGRRGARGNRSSRNVRQAVQ